ncbi:MAG: helix-turn-helix transcriptional regulator [Clostridiales bacterium]|nr:helix-turn-helix transcriptional regulator [Clostridiales bacterium]MBQ1574593.1 helix-turn-helix transcriptional regulator [Clostridiales bacterium]
MKTSREIFAENLRTKLIERNKKQVDLAKYLGTTKATVTHWVNGENMPRMDAIDKICVFLRCEADDLLKDHSKPVEYAPEDIIAEQINENPRLMRLMLHAMKLSDAELDRLIEDIKK